MDVLTATPGMADVFQRLCHMYPESGVGMVGLGSVLLHQKEFIMARALLQKGKSLVSGQLHIHQSVQVPFYNPVVNSYPWGIAFFVFTSS